MPPLAAILHKKMSGLDKMNSLNKYIYELY